MGAVSAAIAVALALAHLSVLDSAVHLAWWVLAAMFCISEVAAVRVRVGRASWTASLLEIPLVLGFFFVSPAYLLLARLLGALAAQAIRRRGDLLVNVVELSRTMLGAGVAVALFRVIVSRGNPLGALGWLAAFVATLVAVIVVAATVSAFGRKLDVGTLFRAAEAMVGAGFALLGLTHLRTNLDDAWLVVIPVVFLWAGLRASAGRQERQQIFELLFEQGALGLSLIDADLAMVRVNPAACRLLGQGKEELTGRSFGDLIYPGDRDELAGAVGKLLNGEAPSYSAERRLLGVDGRVIWANVSLWALRDEEGGVRSCLAMMEDITEEKRGRDHSRLVEERIRRGVLEMTDSRESRSVLQAVVDLARGVLDAEYSALGVMSDSGDGLADFIHSGMDQQTVELIGDLPTGKGLLRMVTSSPEPVRLADLRNHPQSTGVPAHHPEMRSFIGVPIVYRDRPVGNLYLANKVGAAEFTQEDATVLGTLAVQAAVVIENAQMHQTERQLIDKLNRSNTDLKQASKAKSLFVASMSHELRTPLHAMLMAAEILRDPAFAVSEARAKELSGTIASSGRHLLGLIDDLLELSRIEAGRFEVRPEPVAVNLLLTECRQATVQMARKKGVALRIPSVDGIWLEADPLRVRQALLNLLGNAVKFTEPGGRVWVEVSPREAAVTITVCDTGRGISPEDLTRIFDPFEQGTSGTHGVGLGLAISKSIAKAHGGRLEVVTEVGAGSRFELTLPRSNCLVTRAAKPPSVERRPQAEGDLTILVVEDDPRALELSMEVLGSAGYRSVGATTVAQAATCIGLERPDLVLLDVKLGEEDGLEVARQMREDPITRNVPIIASSATTADADIERAKHAGCGSFLAKPLTPQTLLSAVRASLLAAGSS